MVAALSGFVLVGMFLKGVGNFAKEPWQYVGRLLIRVIVALGAICFINLVGIYGGFHLPMNVLTVAIVAIFQIPGLIAVGVLSFLVL